MTQRFEWDGAKAATNLRKQGVSFEEAASVLLDASAYTFSPILTTRSVSNGY